MRHERKCINERTRLCVSGARFSFGRAGLGLVGECCVGGASGGGVAARVSCPPFALSGTKGEL
ncbi:hypothetical protein SAMN02744102_01864 [Paenibacillus barengoltzii]|nr:hypothetical protein SAMN02744102_01864 [Paenibacillus barengoltzii]